MIFSVSRDGNPPCPKCGASDIPTAWTLVEKDGMYVNVGVCESCIWKAVLGDALFEAEADRMVAQAKAAREHTLREIAMRPLAPRPWWKIW